MHISTKQAAEDYVQQLSMQGHLGYPLSRLGIDGVNYLGQTRVTLDLFRQIVRMCSAIRTVCLAQIPGSDLSEWVSCLQIEGLQV